jgi:hypothetical protein
MSRISLNNLRTLELDQMAARAICNPKTRTELFRRISPLDRPVDSLVLKTESNLRNGFIYGYSYVPEGMMFRGLNTGLRRVFKKGCLEQGQLRRDKRGHFFALNIKWAADHAFETVKDNDAILLGTSHYMANIWAANGYLDVVEDLGKFSLDTEMRVYSSKNEPDIPLEDMDAFIILGRSDKKLEKLLQRLPERIRRFVSDRVVIVPTQTDKKTGIEAHAAGYCLSQGVPKHPETEIEKDLFRLLFWEMQRNYIAFSGPLLANAQTVMRSFPESLRAIRQVISADPNYWGKQGCEIFDPLGLIDYLLKTGRAHRD